MYRIRASLKVVVVIAAFCVIHCLSVLAKESLTNGFHTDNNHAQIRSMLSSSARDSSVKVRRDATPRTFPLFRPFRGTIQSLQLINTVTGNVVMDLSNGAVVTVDDIAGLQGPSFNIVAKTQGRRIRSVQFGYNENSKYHVANSAPFSFCSDKGTKCDALGYGSHTVKATPFACRRALCKSGKSFDVAFSIQKSKANASKAPTTNAPAVLAPVVTPPALAPVVTPSALAPVVTPPAFAPVVMSPVLAPVPIQAPATSPIKADNPAVSPVFSPVQVPVATPPVSVPTPALAPANSPIKVDVPAAFPIPVTRPPTRAPTKTPTMAPTSCTTALVWYVNKITLSGRNLTLNGTSPEDKALSWLVNNDALQLKPCTAGDKFRIRQRFALLTLWFQQPVNQKWYSSTDWLTYKTECVWFGITCYETNFTDGTGSQFAVGAVFLYNNSVYGTIPADFGLLSVLQRVSLKGNKLNGTIPATIGRWTNLQLLDLSNNLLRGSIPSSVGNISTLLQLELNSNNLTGWLPTTIGLWTNLTLLNISTNALSGSIPTEVGNLTKVKYLYLNNNRLTGTLPSSIGRLSNIIEFSVIQNQFVGSIPTSISSWKNTLEEAAFFSNRLTGTVPVAVCRMPSCGTCASGIVKVSCPAINITGCFCCQCV